MQSFDVAIAGAGVIGMACALELHAAGLRVALLERRKAGGEASWAAAGMLAAHDSANPPELQALAELSLQLYPAFLERIRTLGGETVEFETEWTLEAAEGWRHHRSTLPALRGNGFRRIAEHSLDPRKLTAAMIAAVRAAGIELLENTRVKSASVNEDGIVLDTAKGTGSAGTLLDCTGAWSAAPVHPAKGQMLRVHAPGVLSAGGLGNVVVRTPDVYMVPRRDGSVVIGATVEDAGFDRTVHEADLLHLRAEAAELLPALADAPLLDSWAGLRPDTPDHLPLLGRRGPRAAVAAGHFRNGILLAPATARVMAQLLQNQQPEIDLAAFDPARFAAV